METRNTQKTFTLPTNREEWQQLETKVRNSNTYKNSWCVIRFDMILDKYRRITHYHKIMIEGLTKEAAEDTILHLKKTAKEYTTSSKSFDFQPLNPFETFDLYCSAGGSVNARAKVWNEIKNDYIRRRQKHQA